MGDVVLTVDGDGQVVPGVVLAVDPHDSVASVLAFIGGGCLRLDGLALVSSAGQLAAGTYCPKAGA